MCSSDLFSHALHLPVSALRTQTAQGAAILDAEVNRQAAMISYDNLYRLSMYLTIGAACFLPLMRFGKQQASANEAAVVEV